MIFITSLVTFLFLLLTLFICPFSFVHILVYFLVYLNLFSLEFFFFYFLLFTLFLIHKLLVVHIEYEITKEAMNFMSYVAELSRGWNKPNARDMRKMMSQPNAKGEMNILNDGIDMKAKIAAMARRLEELEMKKMQEVQAISQTPLQAMPCAICLSYEHLVEECLTIPTVREMFGD